MAGREARGGPAEVLAAVSSEQHLSRSVDPNDVVEAGIPIVKIARYAHGFVFGIAAPLRDVTVSLVFHSLNGVPIDMVRGFCRPISSATMFAHAL